MKIATVLMSPGIELSASLVTKEWKKSNFVFFYINKFRGEAGRMPLELGKYITFAQF